MGTLWSDFRFALRSLAKARGYTAVVVLTLGLGIGATSGVFSAFHAALLASMPYPEPDRLVMGRRLQNGERWRLVSIVDYLDYREQATSFTSLAATWNGVWARSPVTADGAPEWVRMLLVSENLFSTLGVSPVIGRTFTAEEGAPVEAWTPGQPARTMPATSAVVSHGYWQRRFGGSPDVLGRSFTYEGRSVTVVGVLPPGFFYMGDADVFLPIRLRPGLDQRRYHNLILVGRLKPGVTQTQAQGEIDAISKRIERQYPESNRGKGLYLTPLNEARVERIKPVMLLVMGTVALMLLIACANVANLALARGVTRRSELAVRSAVGASRWRLVRGLMVESVTVSLVGGLFGVAVASALQRLLPSLLNLGQLGISELHLDLRLLVFAAAVSLFTGVAVGIAPALRSTEGALAAELAGSSRTVSSRSGARLRLVLVGTQVALSMVLLLGSALLVRSLYRLLNVELGFEPEHLVAARLALPSRYATDESRYRFFSEALSEIRALPGVEAAGMVSQLPIIAPGGDIRVWTPEQQRVESTGWIINFRKMLPGYFQTMGMPLLAGRDLSEADRADARRVLVVNRSMASNIFGKESPLGRKVVVDVPGQAGPVTFDIVGVVADARDRVGVRPPATMYLPFSQFPEHSVWVAIRTTVDPRAVTGVLRDVIRRREKDVPVDEVATMKGVIRGATLAQQALTGTVAAFSLVAVLLAGLGLFGILAYQVNQRTHELGVRMALGARRGHVLTTVVGQGMAATVAGVAAGVAASFALSRFVVALLFETTPTDPLSLAAAAAGLVAVALLACLLPARRALAIEPVQALRYE